MLSIAGAVLLLAGPLGTRAGLWNYRVGFLLVLLAALLGVSGAIASLTRVFSAPSALAALTALIGALVFALPIGMAMSFRGVPAIHDITTNPADPPLFERLLQLRQGAANPAGYDGGAVAAKQRAAYPDLEPLVSAAAPAAAFARAADAARALQWQIVAEDPLAGRIEAVDTTRWFGFKDDVVIRIRPHERGSVVDVRSKSRVGVSDGGANARRIRALLRALRD